MKELRKRSGNMRKKAKQVAVPDGMKPLAPSTITQCLVRLLLFHTTKSIHPTPPDIPLLLHHFTNIYH